MPEVMDSILLSVKKLNNVAPDYEGFDADFVIYINDAFSDLHQLGIGPDEGFSILDADTTWDEFVDDDSPLMGRVRVYVTLHVRLSFDPPAIGYTQTMMKEQLAEKAQRLIYAQEDLEAGVTNG